MTLVSASGLIKRFGAVRAVNGISLQVAQGEVTGFLGPNGAGKSTTMKMVCGFLEPDAGRAEICEGLEFLGVELDPAKNAGMRSEGEISKDGSKVKVWVIPTNEELAIARDTLELTQK